MQDLEKPKKLESLLSDLISPGGSPSGVEELLRIASKFSLQLSGAQLKTLMYFKYLSMKYDNEILAETVREYTEIKQYNRSDVFIMKALEFISLRKFIGENTFGIDIKK